MVLTEETHTATNICTMETGRSTAEDPIFGQPGGANEVETTRYPTPSSWSSNSSVGNSVSRLGNLAGHTMGPNVLQKVMAGDEVCAQVQYYYETPATSNSDNLLPALLSSLAQAISGGGAASDFIKGNGEAIASQLNGTAGFVNVVQPASPPVVTPQAYLTILFFDERFQFISEADGGVYQQQVAATVTPTSSPLALTGIKAPKNGYVYVYVSNRSDQDVYFDNLQVRLTTGNIIEENHYYAFGLKIAGISSRKLGDGSEGKLKNPYQYNGKEMLDEDADLNWYDYGFRNYDPQIGRFPQLDPLTDAYPSLAPYQYASCDPITNIDVDGLGVGGAVGDAVGAGRDFSYASSAVNDAAAYVTPIFRVITGGSKTTSLIGTFGKISSIVIQSAITTANLINNKMNTDQVGNNFVANSEQNKLQIANGSPRDDGTDPAQPGYNSFMNSIKSYLSNRIKNFENNTLNEINWIEDLARQGLKNAKANWNAGRTLPQRMVADLMENPLSVASPEEEFTLLREGLGIREALPEIIKYDGVSEEIANEIEILKDAAKFKGDFNLGEASAEASDRLGKAWVGDEYTISSDGSLLSKDKLRQYRPPSAKRSKFAHTGIQSNFESRNLPKGKWQNNGHLNITDP